MTAATREVVRHTGSPAEWDAFVRAAEGSTFCHLSAWREVLADVMGQEPRYLCVRDESGGLNGVLPLVELRSRLFGTRLVSMPLLNYGGPLGGAQARDLLLAHVRREAELRGARVEVRTRQTGSGALPVAARKVTVLLPLPDTSEELWNGLRSKLRSQVRRPMKEGMQVRFGPAECLPFYDVYRRNMRDLGTPALPRALFERVRDAFGSEALFATVYHGDVPVAAGAGFLYRGEFEITWASSLREYSSTAPNMLLYWSMMEEVIRRGASTFNFGRCTPGEGTHRFKLQWGGHDQELPWHVWPEPGADNGEPGRAARLASEAWQRLPIAIANRLGPVIAKQLPWW